MSRLLTMSELYSLLLHHHDLGKPESIESNEKNSIVSGVQLDVQSPVLWVGPPSQPRHTPKPERMPHRVKISAGLLDAMEGIAAASGLSEGEAWAEAAEAWILQRQNDLDDLASPAGREIARVVQHVWSTIDDQLRDLRNDAS